MLRYAQELKGVTSGKSVDFTLAVEKESNYAEHIQIHHYETVEQGPLTARRLKLLNQLSHPPLDIGQTVPNFILTDQSRHRVEFARLSGNEDYPAPQVDGQA
jgi:hypothetical protein